MRPLERKLQFAPVAEEGKLRMMWEKVLKPMEKSIFDEPLACTCKLSFLLFE